MAVGQVVEGLSELLTAALAPSSIQLYRRAWSLYRQCQQLSCESKNVSLPLSVSQVSWFVSYLHCLDHAPASIVSYVSALGYVHNLGGYPDPTSALIVQKLLAGANRLSSPRLPRLPITIFIMHKLFLGIDKVIQVRYHRLLLKAMLSISFFGLMRIGEVTMSKHKLVPLMLSQITISHARVIISITHFKHNRSARPVDVPLDSHPGSPLCPVSNLTNYLAVRGSWAGPLFAFASLTPVTREFFSNNLKLLLTFAGYYTSRYQAHSLRIGGASYYSELGYPDSQIRLLGRWGSNGFLRYIRSNKVTVSTPSSFT